ncbi:MAG: UDP-2,3-diacylglucosamine diphosphatase [Granulosicoccus sp.]
MGSHTVFIADLHLDPGQPLQCQLALNFLQQARHAKALYILGDLFEYWIGDDAGIPLYNEVVDALAVASAHCQITIMLGNRDFLLGEEFASAANATLIREDELVIELDGKPVLLLHGDTLCTEDREYQAFRQQVRDPQWQQTFLDKTIDERIAYANYLREQSKQLSAEKTTQLMDVCASQVQSRFDASACKTMIHGHTHRPHIHTDKVTERCRVVLGDWHPDHALYALHDSTGLHLRRFESI